MDVWTHPDLGEFRIDSFEEAWAARVSLPALEAFGADGSTPPPAPGIALLLQTVEGDPPSEAMASMAAKVIQNAAQLAGKIKRAFFEDFHARGPDSGMWWRGAASDVAQSIGQDQVTSPDDLEKLLGRPAIFVGEDAECTLDFPAVFEEEHGVSVLTDGLEVLGLGYLQDVLPFGEV